MKTQSSLSSGSAFQPALARRRSIRWIVNVALLLGLMTCAGLALKRYYSHNRSPDVPNISPSARISIAGVDFSQSSETVLLALAKNCHYCTDSARFYRRLVRVLADNNAVKIIAVLPDSPSEAQWYLKTLDISIEEVKQARLSSLGIRNVPALVLLDRKGVVKNVWIGKLPPKTESEVLQSIGATDTRPTSDWLINMQEVERRRKQSEKIILVDLRDRGAYAREHFPNSSNIPFDELNARAQNELSSFATIVLFSDDGAVADRSYQILARQDFPQVLILDSRQ